DAKKFLRDVLVNGPVPSNEILEEAEANGISRSTLVRAKADLKIKAKKDGVRGGWTWLPPEQPTRKEDAASERLSQRAGGQEYQEECVILLVLLGASPYVKVLI